MREDLLDAPLEQAALRQLGVDPRVDEAVHHQHRVLLSDVAIAQAAERCLQLRDGGERLVWRTDGVTSGADRVGNHRLVNIFLQ